MKERFAPDRHHYKSRFHHESDGARLVGLGVVLLALSVITIADLLSAARFPGHFGGSSAMFGGVAIAIYIIKIGRSEIYLDWILHALFYVCAGLVLSVDETLSAASSVILFCILLLASGAARIHIGLSAEPRAGAAWIASSGFVAVLNTVWVGATWIFGASASPAVIVAIDTTFQGLSIVAFGRSFGALR